MSTQSEHEHVVAERLTIPGDNTVLRVHHVVKRAAMPLSAKLRRCVLQTETSRSLDRERLLR